jgi:hypothetical protein
MENSQIVQANAKAKANNYQNANINRLKRKPFTYTPGK